MTLDEYIELAKQELEAFRDMYKEENKKDPDIWPLEMEKDEWGDQELAERFSRIL
jgi:hypothetical protein